VSRELFWKVKPKRFVRDRRGVIVGNPGDMLAYTDANALASPSSVVATWGDVPEESPPPPSPAAEPDPPVYTNDGDDPGVSDEE